MEMIVIETSSLVRAGADRYVVAHAVFADSAWAWGAWRASARGTYRPVLGPLPSYTSEQDGFATLGICDLTTIDHEFPTPPDLPLAHFTRERLGEYSPPAGAKRGVMRPKRSWRWAGARETTS
ncbi:hypothetical protein [Xylanimonas ulmi]|uniref:Uncharacterized protein n=1 Tax=Xylanimonas ulmi TaxID=228973 RepID=A0A4Q7M0Z1_9MICO|nr:hypothetical protein [Xylanibacterium ulmi]RZS60871.1 hypothetical protein EV386_1151 [Xylanibacterium ulmi]